VCRSYYVVAQAGSIAFRLALDTGSADTFLLSTACASRACASVPRYPLLYDSPTFGAVNANGTAFNVSYADGTRESRPSTRRARAGLMGGRQARTGSWRRRRSRSRM
jgi:hypothetical protein